MSLIAGRHSLSRGYGSEIAVFQRLCVVVVNDGHGWQSDGVYEPNSRWLKYAPNLQGLAVQHQYGYRFLQHTKSTYGRARPQFSFILTFEFDLLRVRDELCEQSDSDEPPGQSAHLYDNLPINMMKLSRQITVRLTGQANLSES